MITKIKTINPTNWVFREILTYEIPIQTTILFNDTINESKIEK